MKACVLCKKEKESSLFSKGAKGIYTNRCKSCAKDLVKKWRHENPDKTSAARKRRYWKNPEKFRKASRAAYRKNPNYAKEYSKQWTAAHPGKHNKYRLAYYRRFPEKRRAMENHRLHRKRSNGNYQKVSFKHWVDILANYNHRCAYCGTGGKLTRDHVLPLSKGGAHAPHNIVPACRKCNGRKQDHTNWVPRVFSDLIAA